MENVLTEIGKLRNEMKLGFIEVDNRLTAANDALLTVNDSLKNTQESLVSVCTKTVEFYDFIGF